MARLENPVLDKFLKGTTPDQGPMILETLLRGIIEIFITVGLFIFIIYFFLGAFAWMTSQGDESKIKEAQKRIENAAIGLFLIFCIFVFLKVLGVIFGLDWLQDLKILLLPLVS